MQLSVSTVRIRFLTTLLVSIATLVVPGALADITAGELTDGSSFDEGGVFELIAAPEVLGNNAYDDNNVRAFNEVQDLALIDNQILDIAAPDLPSNVLAFGSVVSSHYIIYDPVATRTAIGSVTFDEPVLGVIISNVRFDETDSLLGNPTTSYDIGSQSLENTDRVTISGNTVTFDLLTSSPGDAIRVITGVDPEFVINICETDQQTITGAITGGSALDNGGRFRQICDPIGAVGDDNFDSFDLFAFAEQQSVELTEPLFIDATTIVAPGEFVSSYYVVWDPVPTNRVIATLTFPDTIIGVITDRDELVDSEYLGNASANYLNPGLLGLEGSDNVTVDGANLTIDFTAGSPGDSVRVILGSASPTIGSTICEPEQTTLTGAVTGGSAASAGGEFVQLCDPIGPVGNDNFQLNDLFAFEEMQNVPLAQTLVIDEPIMTVLEAGTLVSSYYVAFDPGASRDIVGSITFPGQILGLATSTSPLASSDYLGNSSAIYLNPDLRGLESGDFASFSSDTLSVTFAASSPGDYIRVLIAGTDSDGDGIADDVDNCTLAGNAEQLDGDADGFGNACDGDFNNDCAVNVVDLGILRTLFFSPDAEADLNGDGVVNIVDLGILRTLFFSPPGPSGVPNVCD